MDELALIVMASGFSTRFNGNKLLCDVGGKPMIRRVLEAIPPGYRVAVVTRYALVKALALEMGFAAIDNSLPDLRDTIRLGLDALDSYPAACFMVGDQPWITKETLAGMRMDYINHPGSIVRAAYNGKPGNPVIFPRALFPELKSLAARESGSSVIKRHGELTRLYPASERELCDVDRINDL